MSWHSQNVTILDSGIAIIFIATVSILKHYLHMSEIFSRIQYFLMEPKCFGRASYDHTLRRIRIYLNKIPIFINKKAQWYWNIMDKHLLEISVMYMFSLKTHCPRLNGTTLLCYLLFEISDHCCWNITQEDMLILNCLI